MVEAKAKKAADAVREAVKTTPLIPAKTKQAILGLAEAVEALAHEVEILKIRARGVGAGDCVLSMDIEGRN